MRGYVNLTENIMDDTSLASVSLQVVAWKEIDITDLALAASENNWLKLLSSRVKKKQHTALTNENLQAKFFVIF